MDFSLGTHTESTESNELNNRQWFVLRDLKRPNAKLPAFKMLEESGFNVFTPKQWRMTIHAGKPKRELRPVLPDLLFANTTREELDPVINTVPTLQYRYQKGTGYCCPMTVPDADMERFIRAVDGNDTAIYYSLEEITPDMCGRKVRIIGGPLDGTEAPLVKMRGSRIRRILVELPMLMAAAVEVEPEYIQLL